MTDVPRITPQELNSRVHASDRPVIVDVRRASYAESDVKISGAIRIEPDRLDTEYRRIPDGANVVTYCT